MYTFVVIERPSRVLFSEDRITPKVWSGTDETPRLVDVDNVVGRIAVSVEVVVRPSVVKAGNVVWFVEVGAEDESIRRSVDAQAEPQSAATIDNRVSGRKSIR